MRFEKQLLLDAPVDRVFGLIDDVEKLATCIPGLEELTIHDPRHFDSRVRVSVGPIVARLSLTTTLEVVEPPHRIVMVSEGTDRALAGRVKQRQEFAFRPDGDRTRVSITTDVQLQGRLATFGQRIIGARADQFADEVAENVSRLLADIGKVG